MNKLYSIQLPDNSHIEQLRQLWKDTFGDTDTFLDLFFETAFSFERCMCVTYDTTVVAALYWFDCTFCNQKIAYIYAVATANEFRGQGLCHALMQHTHLHLKENGYAGAILSPAEDSLFEFYKKMGYQTCTYVKEILYDSLSEDMELKAAALNESSILENTDLNIRQISKTEFAKLRRTYLSETAVIQENENLDFLEQQANFYSGKDFLLTAQIINVVNDTTGIPKQHLHGIEFLGNPSIIPSLVHAFACTSGTFRTIGTEKSLGMYYSFAKTNKKPNYLGFIYD